jgi:2'-5' RNA ligase
VKADPAALEKPVVVGVIIAVPEPHASVLTRWRRRVGDPQAGAVAPHVTLLSPTPVARAQMDEIDQHLSASAVGASSFTMHLYGTGTFRPLSPVVFIQVARGLADCEVLEQSIRSGPLGRELAFPYHPHVTVAQEIPDDALDAAYEGLAAFVARFPVNAFSLFERTPGRGWQHCREYELSHP